MAQPITVGGANWPSPDGRWRRAADLFVSGRRTPSGRAHLADDGWSDRLTTDGWKIPGVGFVTTEVAKRAAVRAMYSLGSLIGLPIRQLSGLVPRDPHLVAIGGTRGRFTDNPRYLFLALADDDVLECVWIARTRRLRDEIRSMGLRSELRWSPSGLWVSLRAGWYAFGSYPSDVNYWTSKGARTLNLWHGVGIKAVEFAITAGPLLRVYRSRPWSPIRLAFVDRFERPDYFLSTTRWVTERCFADAFRLPVDRFLEFGYPRTDHFFDDDAQERARSALGLGDDVDEIVGYFPTWRDQGNDFIAESGLSFDELNAALARGGRTLVFKAHPNFSFVTPTDAAWSNILILDAAADLNQVLPACDAIVTDYSSVAYDFVLLDRPVVFFVPDYERYVSNRNSNFSFDEMAVGPIVRTCEELYEIVGAPTLPEVDRTRADRIRTLLWGDYNGASSERIRAFIVESAG